MMFPIVDFETPLFICNWYCVIFLSLSNWLSLWLTASFSCIPHSPPCDCTMIIAERSQLCVEKSRDNARKRTGEKARKRIRCRRNRRSDLVIDLGINKC